MHLYKYDENTYINAKNKNIANNIYYNLIYINKETHKEQQLENIKQQEKIKKQQEKQEKKRNQYYNQVIEGYVYVFACNGYYKIGKSKNPEKRLLSFKTGTPFPIDIVQIYKSRNMNILEKLLHNLFSDKQIEGEWFNLNDDDIKIISYKKYDNFIKSYIDDSFDFKRKLRIPSVL